MLSVKNNTPFERDYLDFVLKHFDIAQDPDVDINVEFEYGDLFSIKKNNNKVLIVLTNLAQLFFAFNILSADYNKQIFEYVKTTAHKTIGFMLDCSRSAVLNVKNCKELIVLLAKLGYNALELYTEDTYEIPSEPYFGHLRGRYTQKELKELDAFAKNYGIELIPCIQTLSHLDNIFLWPEYWGIHDIWDCLLIGDDKSYELIDKMFQSAAECFSSRTIHIGLDEAYYAGRGVYLNKNGYIDKKTLLLDHLEKVLLIAKKYGFVCKVYSDMLTRHGCYDKMATLPDNVNIVYWDYYKTDKRSYHKKLDKLQGLLPDVEFRAGDWKWLGNTPMNRYGMRRTRAGMLAANERKLTAVSLSAWGDNGNECSVFATIPQIIYFSMLAYFGEAKNELLKNVSKALTNVEFGDFMKLDLANTYKLKNPKLPVNPAKYLLLNDPLCGIMDRHVDKNYNEYYRKCARTLKSAKKRADKWAYLFDEQIALCEYLAVKANMGNDLYELYQKNDIAGLVEYSKTNVRAALKRLDRFISIYRKAWYIENKTFGFDVSENRLGGQKQRLIEIQLRIQEYAEGAIDSIEELEQPKLLYDKNNEEGLLYIHNSKYVISPFFPVV